MSTEFFNFESIENNHEDFFLRYISISKFEEDWHPSFHAHQFSEIFYIIKGEGKFYIENEKIFVKEDDVIFINPNVEHTEKPLKNNPMEYICFGVDGFSFVMQDGTKGYNTYNYSHDKKYFIDFAKLILKELNEKNLGYEKICYGLLQSFLTYIARKDNLSVISESTLQAYKKCSIAKRYIDTNYAKNITLESLAEISHVNKFYLAHSFTKCIGQSPINYLTNKRIEMCKELLSSSDMSVTQIASNVGFSSQSYFSQTFKSKTGMSPLQYRKTFLK